jgi:tetratricopeptide (TPR) repeat protein
VDVALLTLSGTTEVEALELLDEARRAGVLSGTRFAHDLYRETILDGLGAPAAASINLALGRALRTRPGAAARIAAHLLAAGPRAHREAVEHLILAAREATARLGHDDAAIHYRTALEIIDEPARRNEILLELAAAHGRAGRSDAAMRRFREAATAARDTGDATTLAKAALGVQSLGHRSGGQSTEMIDLLSESATLLEATDGSLSLRSQVFAALARALRHGMWSVPDAEVVTTARQAVELATQAGDAHALADAILAEHDANWYPGTAGRRLPITAAMLAAATESGDDDLVAEAHLLRATALLELGDPAGREELLTYIAQAGELGHARGRWGALTRQATFAQLAGQAEEAARLGEQALELGTAIGIPDAFGCYATCRGALVALGVPQPPWEMDTADSMWPMFPLMKAWAPAARGDLAAAREALGDFSVLDILTSVGLEGTAVAAVVFAAVGSKEQKTWAYQQLQPHAGTHVVVGGCAAYHAAVDHHLGTLAAALGDTEAAEAHFRSALAMHERLGAAGWARLTRLALAALNTSGGNEFRAVNGGWQLSFRGTQVRLPDSKGLRDIATLIGARGANVHVFTLTGQGQPGADPVLDDRAKAEFKARIDALATELDRADDLGDAERSEKLRAERDALIHELAAAAGLGGRRRRLGDEAERARKTVSARVRDALQKIDRVHPDLAGHLRDALRMGTLCSYTPREPTSWRASVDPAPMI